MKVKDVIAQLQEHNPEDELLVYFWDETTIMDASDCSKEAAVLAIKEMENYDKNADDISAMLYETARNIESTE